MFTHTADMTGEACNVHGMFERYTRNFRRNIL